MGVIDVAALSVIRRWALREQLSVRVLDDRLPVVTLSPRVPRRAGPAAEPSRLTALTIATLFLPDQQARPAWQRVASTNMACGLPCMRTRRVWARSLNKMTHTSLKLASLLGAACLWLSGCASAPQLGQADTGGFNAAGKGVVVDYTFPIDKESTAKEQAELRDKRIGEVHQLLQQHGFRAVPSGASAFKIRVVEGAATEVTGEWKGALGANLVIFTLGVVPAMFDYRSEFRYELWAGEKRVHQITTPAKWEEAVGLVSLATALRSEDASRQKARVGAHDSVIRLWIDQGSFE